MDFLAEELHAETVYGAHEIIVIAAMHHSGDSLPHLSSSLVRECKAEYVGRVDSQHVHEISVTVSEGFRLPCPSAGNNPYATFRRGHRLCLPAVQIIQRSPIHSHYF